MKRFLAATFAVSLAFVGVGLTSTGASAVTTPTPGSLDTSFDPGTGLANDGDIGPVGADTIVVQRDGRILIGGQFRRYNSVGRGEIARVNPNGTLDTTFDPGDEGFNGYVTTLNPLANGQVIVGGGFTYFNDDRRGRIARLNTNGSLDLEYPAGGDPHDPDLGFTNGVNDIVTLGNGDQLAATRSYWYGDNVSQGLTQLNPNGTYNPSFTPGSGIYGGTGPVEVIVPQANGNLMVGGGFSEYGGVSRSGIARLHADGTLDTTFDPGTGFRADAGPPNVVSIIPSGSGFIIGGAFTLYNGVYRGFVARVEADGSLDQTFATGSGFDLQVNAMAVQPDGKVLVAGNFYHYNGVEANGSARLFPNGELDTSFTAGTGLDGVVTSLALQPDGKALVGGYFSHYNGIARNGIARLYAYTPPQQQFPVNGCVTAGGTTSIPTTGTKQLMKAGCRTNAGQVIGVTVGARLRGDLRLDTLYCKKSNGRITATSSTGRGDGSRYCRSGVLRIRTHGKHLQIRVTWSAPPKGAYTAYRTSRNYRN